MANRPLDTAFLDKAIKFAVDAHAGTERRGKGYPYVIHVLEAMEIVASMTSDKELLAAAVLHDTVEDTCVTLEQIRSAFGDKVARLVEGETAEDDGKTSWRDRRNGQIKTLEDAPLEVKMVALGDKLSNMRALDSDYAALGDALWSRFHAPDGKKDYEWYYRGLARALCPLAGTDAYREFTSRLQNVFGGPNPELIDANEYTRFGEGFTAQAYNSADGRSMIKLYSDYIGDEVPLNELRLSWSIMDLGVKIPAAYRLVTDGQRKGVEFERVRDKKSFARAISDDPASLERYAALFAAEAKKLHATKCSTDGMFPSIADRFLPIIEKADDFSPETKEKMKKFVNGLDGGITTCLHGDFHIGNILTCPKGVYWIDIADFGYGDPRCDVGMLYLCSHMNPEELTQELFHISNTQILRFWEVFCREYYGPERSLEDIDKEIKPFAGLYAALFSSRHYCPKAMAGEITEVFNTL